MDVLKMIEQSLAWLFLCSLIALFLWGFPTKVHAQDFEFGKPYQSVELLCFNRNDAVELAGIIEARDEEKSKALFTKKTCFVGNIFAIYEEKIHASKVNVYRAMLYRSNGVPLREIWVITDEKNKPKGTVI